MNNTKILRAIGDIDEDLIARAGDVHRSKFAVRVGPTWLKWAMPLAACLVIGVAIAVPQIMKMTDYAGDSGAGQSTPGLTLDGAIESAASYVSPDEWQGLPSENFVLDEKADGGVVADRMGFLTLDNLAAYADVWVVVPNVHETARDGKNMQTSITEYAETIGDVIITREWDDRTVSTGSRVLIRQNLIGGCTMDEPNNLLRVGGVYLLPLKFNPDWGWYEVAGDLDVLFELNSEGKIVSHSRFPEFSKYNGKPFSELLDDVRALYPAPEAEFTEKPINSLEEAENQVNAAYLNFGFRKFSALFDSMTVQRGADAYLFKVTFGEDGVNGSEYAAIATLNGAFIRGEMDSDGEIKVSGGMGSFPKNSR